MNNDADTTGRRFRREDFERDGHGYRAGDLHRLCGLAVDPEKYARSHIDGDPRGPSIHRPENRVKIALFLAKHHLKAAPRPF